MMLKLHKRYKAPKPSSCAKTWCSSSSFFWEDGEWICEKCGTAQPL